ncbi:MGT family glycosyltransferase [Leifsonia sp. AK011]|uniref:nucleotide disphospho-sugar-binding domain-containing protein n=1 Tax=Leifsonia sp. AK011 TaxID=2723075 RepID=UPI0015CA55C9|nr:nucleotide disphospho-sugar-binding domain-containing protein [Leifsonia sp. AK011]NYF10254.1 MGT family glycosyltransferase [Leifsonia sp. AK011]
MSTFLLCSTPVHGHVMPVLGIGRALVQRGHRVVLLTGSRFEKQARDAGLEFRALQGIADFDDRDADTYLPDRNRYRGIARAQYDIKSIFVATIPDQFASVQAALINVVPDAILVDGAFAGVTPLLFGSAPRPPIVGVGVTPLSQSSADVAPFGMGLAPLPGAVGRLRNRFLGWLANRVFFRETHALAKRILAELGVVSIPGSIMDVSRSFDRFLQLTPAELEYPRRDLGASTRFVGPVPSTPGATAVPEWWPELDGTRPVVHVTQGTIDNVDLSRLIGPTVEALGSHRADAPLVVVTLGGRGRESLAPLGTLPPNVRVADYLPYDKLLPLCDVVVTNGGFGGVLQALRAGVPVVVAGDTEDKPEVAARVAWAGVGVDLRTGRPDAAAVASAVNRVLTEKSFRSRAAELSEAIGRLDTIDLIEGELKALVRGS